MTTRRVSLLGATGSIGDRTLDVIGRRPGRFAVVALAAHRQWEKLAQCCHRHRPQLAALRDSDAVRLLERAPAGHGLAASEVARAAGLCAAAASPDADTMLAAAARVRRILRTAPREAIEVVVDPESVIHSLVEYVDGRVLAQLRNPDIHTPIAAACAETLARVPARPVRGLDDVPAADAEARAVARARLKLPAPSSPLAA
jgi:1-deoxy-D-xylulose 5-phosphate reductoisomerase